jgi:hypothetical protein
MCLAREGLRIVEAHTKALSLLSAQIERWRSALAIHSPGKRKTDIEVLRAYLTSKHSPARDRGGFELLPR